MIFGIHWEKHKQFLNYRVPLDDIYATAVFESKISVFDRVTPLKEAHVFSS